MFIVEHWKLHRHLLIYTYHTFYQLMHYTEMIAQIIQCSFYLVVARDVQLVRIMTT